jgi:hypothetical protein
MLTDGTSSLAVVYQKVVNIEAGTGDGRFLVEARMRATTVVAEDLRFELGETFGRVLLEPGVGPLADGGLDETFRFAIGARGIVARADRFHAELVATGSEVARTEAWAVVAYHAANGDAQAVEVSHRLAQELAGRNAFFRLVAWR